jgi:hypothetical protein
VTPSSSSTLGRLEKLGAWVLTRWRLLVFALAVNVALLSGWGSRSAPPWSLPVSEVLAGFLLTLLALLWATLLADPASAPPSLWRRLGRMPDAFRALLAATFVLTVVLAVLVFLDGLAGLLRLAAG